MIELEDEIVEREEAFTDDWYMVRKMDRTPTFAEAIHWADTHPNWIKRPDLPPHPDDTDLVVYNEIKAACPVVVRELRYHFPDSQPKEKYHVITSMKEENSPYGAAIFLQGITHYLPITLPMEDEK